MAFHQYNKTQYNTAQYNADALFLVVRPTESIGSTDTRIDTPSKVLADSLTSTDARVSNVVRAFAEFVFLVDVVTKSVLNKGFAEKVRVNDWLEIERKSLGNGNGWS